jgi:hypothetical protein
VGGIGRRVRDGQGYAVRQNLNALEGIERQGKFRRARPAQPEVCYLPRRLAVLAEGGSYTANRAHLEAKKTALSQVMKGLSAHRICAIRNHRCL